MVRRRKNKTLVDLVLYSSWKVLGLLVFFVFLSLFVIAPFLDNPTLSAFSLVLKSFGYMVFAALMLIAFRKLYKQISAAINAKKYPLNQDTESPFVRTTMSEFMQRPTSWSLNVLQEIEWKRFEDLSMGYYLEKGILAKSTSLGADGGIDIKLFQDNTGEATSLVQCKAWGQRQVGVKAVREFLGVLSHEKVPKGFLMTSGDFTSEAKAVAKANKINLITGEMFLAMIMRLPEVSQKKLLTLAIAGDYRTPTCSQCGVKMVRRESKRGAFWGCTNFPSCRQKLSIRRNQ
jgi:HJR/Mrr/RecB family endonuclease